MIGVTLTKGVRNVLSPDWVSVLFLRIKWLEHKAYQVLVSIMCGMLPPHLPPDAFTKQSLMHGGNLIS
jgi:hypothetical protein